MSYLYFCPDLLVELMTSQAGQQIITIHILPNISRSKGNQEMQFGQSIKYSLKNIFLQNYAENDLGRPKSPDKKFKYFKNEKSF